VIALYQHDVTGQPLELVLASGDTVLTRALAQAAAERSRELDEVIDRHAHGWSVQRIQPLERSIMRVALLEMLLLIGKYRQVCILTNALALQPEKDAPRFPSPA